MAGAAVVWAASGPVARTRGRRARNPAHAGTVLVEVADDRGGRRSNSGVPRPSGAASAQLGLAGARGTLEGVGGPAGARSLPELCRGLARMGRLALRLASPPLHPAALVGQGPGRRELGRNLGCPAGAGTAPSGAGTAPRPPTSSLVRPASPFSSAPAPLGLAAAHRRDVEGSASRNTNRGPGWAGRSANDVPAAVAVGVVLRVVPDHDPVAGAGGPVGSHSR